MKKRVFSMMFLIVAMSSCNNDLVVKHSTEFTLDSNGGTISLSLAHQEQIYGMQIELEGKIDDDINIAKSAKLTNWNLVSNRTNDNNIQIVMYSTDLATSLPDGEIITLTPFSEKITITNILALDKKMEPVEFQ